MILTIEVTIGDEMPKLTKPILPSGQAWYGNIQVITVGGNIAGDYYVRNKQPMTVEQLADYLYPENCAEKTFILLKLKGE